ncbi:MAG: M24 family metallopeptidase, partial [Candidatus Omnitrophica bacterium]|nr:M24 family metallopeptidase [Candidatus Omnitrophota bacterium]
MNIQIKSLIIELNKLSCDSMLISNPESILCLTGINHTDGFIILGLNGEYTFFTSTLYEKAVKKNITSKVIIITGEISTQIVKEIKRLKFKKVGFESANLKYIKYKRLKEKINTTDITLVETSDLIKNLNIIKTKEQINLIKKSVEISTEAFEYIKEISTPEMTEKDLSIEIEKFLRIKGDNDIAFNSIVASGKNTIFPHHYPTNDQIGKSHCLIDIGSKYKGYCADLTRLIFYSKMSTLLKKVYNIIKKAQDLSIQKIKDGITAGEIDKIARDYITKQGFGKYFIHGLGHGIGLSVHEAPYLQPNN